MWPTFCLILVVCCCLTGADVDEAQEAMEDNDRDMKKFDSGRWRVLDQYTTQDHSGWVPSGQTSPEERSPVRRRIRKRKRRPQVISLTDSSPEESSSDHVVRRVRPYRLEQFREPWEEVSDEFIRKPNNRRRVFPVYTDDVSVSLEGVILNPSVGASISFQEVDDSRRPGAQEDPVRAPPEKIRDPFTALEEAEHKQKPIPNEPKVETTSQESTSSTTAQNLKTLLKQTNGELSLSEILQQKNLSLAELLMGNKKAISALTAKVSREPSSTETADAEVTKYRRLPPSMGARKNISRIFKHNHDADDALTSKETIEAQRRRLALLHAHRDNNKIYSEVTKFEVVTEAMTERRIFVPSHPKYYTSLDYALESMKPSEKPDEADYDKPTQPSTNKKSMPQKLVWSDTTTTKNSIIPKLTDNLPITSAKMNKAKHNTVLNTYSSKPTTIPEKAFKININEIFGFETKPYINQDENKKTALNLTSDVMTPPQHMTVKKDEPLKMTIDLEPVKVESTVESTTKTVDLSGSSPKLDQISTKTSTVFSDTSTVSSYTEKLRQVTAKEEIMEILKDPLSRERLSRILEMRNMTVEELVQQRERGSSQLHLADIFHNKTREPEPQGEPFVGHVSSYFSKNFPKPGRQQKSRPIVTQVEQLSTTETSKLIHLPIPTKNYAALDYEMDASKIDNAHKAEAETPRNHYTITSFPTYKIESDKRPLNEQPQPFLPIWKGIYPDLFSGVHQGVSTKRLNSTKSAIIDSDLVDLQRLDEVDNNKLSSRVKSEKFNVDIAQESFGGSSEEIREQDFISLPSGVKSAIIASLVIVGLSLFVFLTILVVFRYSQKQKQRLCYRNSFSGSKIKSPILETDQQKRNLRTFMTETLGRKKDYYKSHMQSMCDNIWEENDKKPF